VPPSGVAEGAAWNLTPKAELYASGRPDYISIRHRPQSLRCPTGDTREGVNQPAYPTGWIAVPLTWRSRTSSEPCDSQALCIAGPLNSGCNNEQ